MGTYIISFLTSPAAFDTAFAPDWYYRDTDWGGFNINFFAITMILNSANAIAVYRNRTDYSLIERCRNEVADALGETREKEPIAEKLIRNKEAQYREEKR